MSEIQYLKGRLDQLQQQLDLNRLRYQRDLSSLQSQLAETNRNFQKKIESLTHQISLDFKETNSSVSAIFQQFE